MFSPHYFAPRYFGSDYFPQGAVGIVPAPDPAEPFVVSRLVFRANYRGVTWRTGSLNFPNGGAVMTTLNKLADESRLYHFDFRRLLFGSAELISMPAPTMRQEDASTGATSTDLDFGSPTVSSPYVQVRISGGVRGTKYRVYCLATDSEGNEVEVDGYLQVEP